MPDEPRARVLAICESLPGVTVQDGQHIAFDVRRKRFAYYLDDHHGDGRLAVNCKAAPGVQDMLVDEDRMRYFVPAYLGPRGWVGMYLDVDDVDWESVRALLVDAYLLQAPKRLAALGDGSASSA